ncbi:unnamed protein product [Linum tenue]|uniref:F-box domain-containing protein n=1 Tax=Linum tenue TaxID=586396 RepID=A0AAV0GS71_9ROSI|nr:unnamed protein product [Linum tenue]
METKIARTPPAIGGYDRLSFLPDEVISHILSFLETKYAVGTAVLSRRWGDLWTRVSSLDLDSRLVYKTLDESLLLEPLTDIRKRRYFQFRSFVDKVLNQHKNLDSLRHFRLHVLVDYHPEMVIAEVRV